MPRLILSEVEKSLILNTENYGGSCSSRTSNVSAFSKDQSKAWINSLENLGASSAVINSAREISTRAVGETSVVITGQQLGVGISPVLSLYKMFFAEYLATKLSTKTKVVYPVFWMQSEDHDLREVLDSSFRGSDGDLFNIADFVPKDCYENNLSSVGSINSKKLLENFFFKIDQISGDDDYKEILMSLYQEPSETLSTSFSKLFYKLFPETRLVIFDINTVGLESLKTKVISKTLIEDVKIESILLATKKDLESRGFDAPVRIREKSPLFFYHPQGKSGPRYRLEKDSQDIYRIRETNLEITKQELLEKIDTNPEMFSTSALLRPILQDYIFNTVAYVGGSTEINYLKQIENLYKFYDLKEPLRILRPSGVVIDDKSYKHFSLEKSSYFMPYDELKEFLYKKHIKADDYLENLFNEVSSRNINEIESMLSSAAVVDNSLLVPKEKTIKLIKDSLDKFHGKLKNAYLKKDEVSKARIDKLLDQIFVLKKNSGRVYDQERVLSLSHFGLNYGFDFVKELRQQFFEQLSK